MGNQGGCNGDPLAGLKDAMQSQGETLGVSVEAIPPCPEWKQCKIPRYPMGAMILQRRGVLYWIGSQICLRCSRCDRIDLFEDIDSKILAKDPLADKIVPA